MSRHKEIGPITAVGSPLSLETYWISASGIVYNVLCFSGRRPGAHRSAGYTKNIGPRLMLRLTIALLCSATLLGAQDDLDQQLRSIIGAYAIARENAADPVNSEQALYAGAIPAMLRKLDPHSVFFDPEQFEQLKRMETSTSKGFGSVVSKPLE